MVFQQGDAGESAYYLQRGEVDITINTTNNDYGKRLHRYKRHNTIGEMSHFDKQHRSANMWTNTDCTFYQLSRAQYERLNESYPDIALKLLENTCRTLSHRLRITTDLVNELEK